MDATITRLHDGRTIKLHLAVEPNHRCLIAAGIDLIREGDQLVLVLTLPNWRVTSRTLKTCWRVTHNGDPLAGARIHMNDGGQIAKREETRYHLCHHDELVITQRGQTGEFERTVITIFNDEALVGRG